VGSSPISVATLFRAPDTWSGASFFAVVRSEGAMDVLNALRSRRSIGKLGGEVGDDEIRVLIEAATWAPNHRLTEPWRFVVLRGEARERLGRLWAEIVAKRSPLQGEERAKLIQKEAAKPLRAPVLLIVAVRTDDDPIVAIEDFAATAAAVQNVLLAAEALGLGAMWRTGDMVYDPEIKTHLGLDSPDRIVAAVYLGRPEMQPPQAQPRECKENVRWLT
jgi:nitroreductase